MPDIRAAQSGDFSATSTWVGGVVPGSGDTAFANTFTVTISDTRTVQAISNAAGTGITVGGTFSLLNGCRLTSTNANGVVQGGTLTPVITTPSLGPGSSAIVASTLSHTATFTNSTMVTFSSSGTLNIVGSVTGGTFGFCVGISASGSGTLNLTGAVTGGSSSNSAGVMVTGGATVNVTGTVTGGAGANSQGINITAASATVLATGSVIGGAGASASAGIINSSSSTLTVNGSCQSSTSAPAIALGAINQITRLSGPFLLGASGNINPVQAASWRWAPTLIPAYFEVVQSNGSTKRLLYSADNMPSGGYPIAANVRQPTVYGPSNEFTGTLAVPLPSSVALGVPTDNAVGTAILTAAAVQSALTAQGLTTTRANNLDNIATAAPAATDVASAVWAFMTRTLTSGGGGGGSAPTATDVAAAVWSYTARTLTGGIPTAAEVATAVWAFVTRTLTSGSAPTAATVATAVRTELAAELGRVDAAVSTRLAAASYTAPTTPPTAAAIRAEMDTNSTKLANLDAQMPNKASVDQVAAIVQGATSA